ncbi:exonuclease domain-containing protein [Kineococcus sp. LSe6-4]|uniref:Exonuclease domain-containing protein n=1 Tax=Kineococcus halophytocola TaxID=3234027 RepID=A0ABV4GXT4_9ACTN
MLGYAVIDVETTGFHANGTDRVVEVAVVQVDPGGAVEEEWHTLLNPHRDMGPQHIHRIRAAEAAAAPTFDQIMGHLVDRLAGRVLVAHNLPFDVRFIDAEFRRAGVRAPVVEAPGLCTMELSDQYLFADGRSLTACAQAAGISHVDAHMALADAHTAAALLRHCLRCAEPGAAWTSFYRRAASAPWLGVIPAHRTAREAHRRPVAHRTPPHQIDAASTRAVRLPLGSSIVLTGQMRYSREEYVEMAERAGFRVAERVTKKVDAVVAADPDSLSGKARRARQYGIPVISEESFGALLSQPLPT